MNMAWTYKQEQRFLTGRCKLYANTFSLNAFYAHLSKRPQNLHTQTESQCIACTGASIFTRVHILKRIIPHGRREKQKAFAPSKRKIILTKSRKLKI